MAIKSYRVRLHNPSARNDSSCINLDESISMYEWAPYKTDRGPKQAVALFALKYNLASNKEVEVKGHGVFGVAVEHQYTITEPDHLESEDTEVPTRSCIRCGLAMADTNDQPEREVCPGCWSSSDQVEEDKRLAEESAVVPNSIPVFQIGDRVIWKSGGFLGVGVPGTVKESEDNVRGYEGTTYRILLDHATDQPDIQPGPVVEVLPDGSGGEIQPEQEEG